MKFNFINKERSYLVKDKKKLLTKVFIVNKKYIYLISRRHKDLKNEEIEIEQNNEIGVKKGSSKKSNNCLVLMDRNSCLYKEK